jgi:hypothetical protein
MLRYGKLTMFVMVLKHLDVWLYVVAGSCKVECTVGLSGVVGATGPSRFANAT